MNHALVRINTVRKIDDGMRTAGLPLTLAACIVLLYAATALIVKDEYLATKNTDYLEAAYFSRLVDDGYIPGTISTEQAAMIESRD